MTGQRINEKYIQKLSQFFIDHSLEDFQVIYDNEKYFKDWLNSKSFKFTNSGTSALFLILNHLKSQGSKTIWGPAFTHISWVNCAEWLDMKYEFVDVKEETLSLDPDKLEEKLALGICPDIVVMVDMGGYVGEDTLRVKKICEEHHIEFIEDAAHAIGQEYNGIKSGMFGDYSFYSFSNPKLLTAGEGGAIISTKYDIDMVMEEYIYQGGWYRYDKKKKALGLNFIMSNWMTELLRYQLEDIDEIKAKHEETFLKYLEETSDIITFGDSAPSFFARRLEVIPRMVKGNAIKSLMYQRYTNLGGEEFTVSETLQNELLYWKL